MNAYPMIGSKPDEENDMTEETKGPTPKLSSGQRLMHFLHSGTIDADVWGEWTLNETVAGYLDSATKTSTAAAELTILCFNTPHPQAAFWVITTMLALANDEERGQIVSTCGRMCSQ